MQSRGAAAGRRTAGPRSPIVVSHLVVERDDEFVRVRGTGRRFDLLTCRPRTPIGDVVGDGVVEEHRLLRHDADLRPERGQCDLPLSRPSIRMAPSDGS